VHCGYGDETLHQGMLTSVDWNGVLKVEHSLLPMGGCVLGASTEVHGVAGLHVKSNIKVANQSLHGVQQFKTKLKCISK